MRFRALAVVAGAVALAAAGGLVPAEAVRAAPAGPARSVPASDLRWRACEGVRGPRCARVQVPLDRSGALPGSVSLRVSRQRLGGASRGTLIYLSGGPGGAGVEETTLVTGGLRRVLRGFEVIGFDQRGTGYSGLLRCPELERDARLRATAAGERCAQRLGLARARYTTLESVEDLEAVRAAVGAERVTLFGVSYGTKLALAYARAHPDRVDRLILDSVLEPDDAEPFGLAGLRAIGPSLTALCPGRCSGVSDGPVADLATLAGRLRERPLAGDVYDRRGRRHRRPVSEVAIADLLYDADYNPALRAGVPAAVRGALQHGDAAPLLRLMEAARPLAELPRPRSFSVARYATICEETSLPWARGTPFADRLGAARAEAAKLGPDAFAPFSFEVARADEIDLCLRWPEAVTAPALAPPRYPSVPALVLQGGEDLRTPPEASARVAAQLPGARRLVVPGIGHAVLGSDRSRCADRQLARFLAGRSVRSRCPRVPTQVPPAPVAPTALSQLPPARGLPGRVGRTLGAVGVTLDDLAFALSPAFLSSSGSGLRGGTYRAGRRRIELRRLQVVPGVRVSGTAELGGRLRLRVTGSAAARGELRITRGGRLVGRLGGRRISRRLGGASRAGLPAFQPPSAARFRSP